MARSTPFNHTISCKLKTPNKSRKTVPLHELQVTEGQPRVVLHLDRPVAARATLRVTAERAGQLLPVEEVKLKNPHTVMVTLPVCLMAKSCLGKHCCGHHNFCFLKLKGAQA